MRKLEVNSGLYVFLISCGLIGFAPAEEGSGEVILADIAKGVVTGVFVNFGLERVTVREGTVDLGMPLEKGVASSIDWRSLIIKTGAFREINIYKDGTSSAVNPLTGAVIKDHKYGFDKWKGEYPTKVNEFFSHWRVLSFLNGIAENSSSREGVRQAVDLLNGNYSGQLNLASHNQSLVGFFSDSGSEGEFKLQSESIILTFKSTNQFEKTPLDEELEMPDELVDALLGNGLTCGKVFGIRGAVAKGELVTVFEVVKDSFADRVLSLKKFDKIVWFDKDIRGGLEADGFVDLVRKKGDRFVGWLSNGTLRLRAFKKQ